MIRNYIIYKSVYKNSLKGNESIETAAEKKTRLENISRLTTINIIVSPLVLSAFQIIRDQKFCCPEKQ